VGEDEQGQLQGANNSVSSIAGVVSPLFFGWIYSLSAGSQAPLPVPGLSFYFGAFVLLAAAVTGWLVVRSEDRGGETPAP